jgi:hypothetical protein
MINNGDHNYLSNQIMGPLPSGTGNLGGDGAANFTGTLGGVNFNQFAGLQYFSIAVPEPTCGMLISTLLLPMARRRR